MATRLLLGALTLTALLFVASTPAQAFDAGFCAYGTCAGVKVIAPSGAVLVQVCANLVIGCVSQFQVHSVPNPPYTQLLPCNVFLLPAETGANGVVVLCV